MRLVHISFGLSVPEALSLLSSPAPRRHLVGTFRTPVRALPASPRLARLAASPVRRCSQGRNRRAPALARQWPDILGIIALFRLVLPRLHNSPALLGCIFGPAEAVAGGGLFFVMQDVVLIGNERWFTSLLALIPTSSRRTGSTEKCAVELGVDRCALESVFG